MKRYVKWVSLSVLVIVLGIVGYYSYTVYHFANGIQKKPEDSIFYNPGNVKSTSLSENAPPKWEGKEQVNILLLGGDSRGLKQNEIPRSDSIMVASIDPVTKKAYLFSILRDTYVQIPGHDQERINAAITLGGPELAMKTVGNLLGIPIQYYVYTDFKGFIALVDAVGGIDIDVEKDMYYVDAEDDHQYDINLKKGQQHLDGKTALQYVRFRKDAMSDFARTERQRKFMTSLADELQSGWSIVRLPKILNAVYPYVETNLGISDMMKLGSLGMEAKSNEIVKSQLPPMELLEEKTVHGAEVIGVDPKKLQSYVRGLYGTTAAGGAGDSGRSVDVAPAGGSSAGKSGVVAATPTPTKSTGTVSAGGKKLAEGSTQKPPAASVKPSAKPTATPKSSASATVNPTATPTPRPGASGAAGTGGAAATSGGVSGSTGAGKGAAGASGGSAGVGESGTVSGAGSTGAGTLGSGSTGTAGNGTSAGTKSSTGAGNETGASTGTSSASSIRTGTGD